MDRYSQAKVKQIKIIKQKYKQTLYKYNKQQIKVLCMNKTLEQYDQKLGNIQQSERIQLEKVKKNYIEAFFKQLDHSAEQHWSRYKQVKKSTKQELDTVQYYLKLYNQTQNPSEQNEHEVSKWAETLKTVNLYSLFKSIDDKLLYNTALLTSFQFAISFPLSADYQYETQRSKTTIMQQQIKQYSQFISVLLTKLNRPVKDELNQFKAIQQKYTQLLNHIKCQQQYFDLKIKDSHNYVISVISTHKYLKSADLSLITISGILEPDAYERLGAALIAHRFYLETVHIRIMDMEFCQQKCDILKRYLKKLRNLSKLTIHNYYSECKLGQFTDFNWHPYRKNINIKSSVWK